jgi:hypothetical protein
MNFKQTISFEVFGKIWWWRTAIRELRPSIAN